ncbi:pilus assembly protein TadC [Allocatelliglobosispora scoriae]|uniref:Pilus assembly protein TadC n=1 Tax=Allocatelliglobosispora scoriae TaxID=643052 RepID=A0A841BUE9_9ACTN|nr:type II secretion system F family protein [Allocatelliglobosispora scoriae]MBB5871315.1 pilus assembly protein TadC [Allocatelliglobosispora scoriae]
MSGALIKPVLIAAGAGGVLVICVGGTAGIVAGLLGAGALLAFLLRAEPPERRREREAARRDLPLAIDLIAAALRAGAPLDHCLLAVSDSLQGPISERLDRAGRSLALGAPVRDALRHLADLDGAARVVTAAERSSANGAALAGVLQRCAADLRDLDALAVETASRRAGVLIVLPLGLCFLPAFVLAGLVPVLIAYLGDLTL